MPRCAPPATFIWRMPRSAIERNTAKCLRNRLLRRRFLCVWKVPCRSAGTPRKVFLHAKIPCMLRAEPAGKPHAGRLPAARKSAFISGARPPAPGFPRPFPQHISKVCCIYKIWKSAFGGQKSVKILHIEERAAGYGKAVCRRLRARISQEDAPGRSTRPFHAFVQTAGFVCAGSASIPSR